ncbi:caspase-14-like [Amia ocellicauda]|uniref:caspase-14-like n=1 Tax=Amia ocellicauda TaxID=2972642 RepID=UPI003463C5CD
MSDKMCENNLIQKLIKECDKMRTKYEERRKEYEELLKENEEQRSECENLLKEDGDLKEFRELLTECEELQKEHGELSEKRTRLQSREAAELEREMAELLKQWARLLELCCVVFEDEKLCDELRAIGDEFSKRKTQWDFNTICNSGQRLGPADPDRYDMRGRRLALMLCVTNKRLGATMDMRIMRNLFRQYKFDYTIEISPSAQGMKAAVEAFRARIISCPEEVSCCCVVTASHGELGIIVGSDEETVDLKDIIEPFGDDQCPQLQKKPKVFIIQACRGGLRDLGVKLSAEASVRKPKCNDAFRPPVINDMFTVYATQPGYTALRDKTAGSYLFTFMKEVFLQHPPRGHLHDLFVKVNEKMVQKDFRVSKKEVDNHTDRDEDYDTVKVTVLMESTLKKLLYL